MTTKLTVAKNNAKEKKDATRAWVDCVDCMLEEGDRMQIYVKRDSNFILTLYVVGRG
jgi:hypothetical protein